MLAHDGSKLNRLHRMLCKVAVPCAKQTAQLAKDVAAAVAEIASCIQLASWYSHAVDIGLRLSDIAIVRCTMLVCAMRTLCNEDTVQTLNEANACGAYNT